MDSLMPKSESSRLRGQSQMDFKTATTGVAAKAMRNELSALVNTVQESETKKVCASLFYMRSLCIEIDAIASNSRHSTRRCSPSFTSSHVISPSAPVAKICTRPHHLSASSPSSSFLHRSVWDRINSPSEDKIVPYDKLSAGSPSNLNKLAVLKVNGGLGTSMGAFAIFDFHGRAS